MVYERENCTKINTSPFLGAFVCIFLLLSISRVRHLALSRTTECDNTGDCRHTTVEFLFPTEWGLGIAYYCGLSESRDVTTYGFIGVVHREHGPSYGR